MKVQLAWDAICVRDYKYPYPNSDEPPIEFLAHLTPEELAIFEDVWRKNPHLWRAFNDAPDWIALGDIAWRAGLKNL